MICLRCRGRMYFERGDGLVCWNCGCRPRNDIPVAEKKREGTRTLDYQRWRARRPMLEKVKQMAMELGEARRALRT